ncbi:hypothetical protein CIW40_11785 [Escherichia coli]|nr:hypothetical protein [Escherichia coli]EAC2092367.1 hypothetical protein [Escherichia coli]EEV5633628.1 hypothetical protein [Escherichia coli]EEV5838062.1 hypothetical protein [Escherichia coli]EEV6010896.1 hypothetical protein [Escherichia coli]
MKNSKWQTGTGLELQKRFLSEYVKSCVSPKEWCDAQGLSFATARRRIKNNCAMCQRAGG